MGADMNEQDKNQSLEDDKEENDSFVEGFSEGFIETMIHPFRWGRKLIIGRDDD